MQPGTTLAFNDDGHLVVLAPESLWSDNAEAFRSAVLCGLRESTRAVELNLSRTAWFDTSALCMLIMLRRRLSIHGIHLRIVDPGLKVLTILDMTRTRKLFDVAGGCSSRPPIDQDSEVEVDPQRNPAAV